MRSRRRLAAGAHVAHHAKGGLDALVVAGNLSELAVTARAVEGARRLVPGAQLQPDDEGAGGEGGLLEPLQQESGNAATAVCGSDGEEIQVRHVVGVAHDGEAGEREPGARGKHDAVRMTYVAADARRAPRRREAALHELA